MTDNNKSGNGASNLARAVWVFLGYTLVGPFISGIVAALLVILANIAGVSDFFKAGLPPLGTAATSAFVWAAIPCAITALLLLPFIFQKSTFGWIEAATAGVFAFAFASIVVGFPYREALPFFAFLAAMVSLGVREALRNGRIIG